MPKYVVQKVLQCNYNKNIIRKKNIIIIAFKKDINPFRGLFFFLHIKHKIKKIHLFYDTKIFPCKPSR